MEAIDIMTKGMIKTEDFLGARAGVDWQFEANLIRFNGPKGASYQVGQQHDVHVANVDMERQMVDFKFAE